MNLLEKKYSQTVCWVRRFNSHQSKRRFYFTEVNATKIELAVVHTDTKLVFRTADLKILWLVFLYSHCDLCCCCFNLPKSLFACINSTPELCPRPCQIFLNNLILHLLCKRFQGVISFIVSIFIKLKIFLENFV